MEDRNSRLVLVGEQPPLNEKSEININAKAIREVVDPIDQTRDIISALNYLAGEPGIDISRIGIWGTSYSGGHVIYVAAQDKELLLFIAKLAFRELD